MTDWNRAFEDQLNEIARQPAARAPATLGEIWNTEWKATGLDTTFGVRRPMMDAYSELQDRLTSVTGKDLGTLARERNLDFMAGGFDGRVQTMGQIIDTLPDPQQKLLADYKDVRARARAKAAEIERQRAEVAGATYGISGYATAFVAGVVRQSVDPINLATMPIGGPAKGPVLKWLGKEFLIGAGVQAAQEPFIAPVRQELGLETNSIENILQAGIGQAGLAGLLRGAAALWRAGRQAGNPPPVDLTPPDVEAVARRSETDDLVMRQTGPSREAQQSLERATAALNGQAPIEAAAPARVAAFSLEGPQRVVVSDELAFHVRYAVVERRDLITSHSSDGNVNPAFPPEIQPRDRSTMEMRQQLQDIAGKLEPSWLTTSPNAQFGAPIVSDRGIVESGNGRTLSIGLAYERFPERAQAYRDELERLGFDTAAFREPVLVRIRQDELSPQQLMGYTARSNVSEVAKLSVAEQAALDARNLHGGVLEAYQGGDLTRARNAEFVRRFIQELVPVADQNAFIAGGRPTEAGIARMQAALLARAWQDARMVREIAENPNPTSITILRAFADTAPQISRLRAAIEEGRVDASADIVSPLKAAFDLVERARLEGRKLTMLVDQSDVETGAVRDDVRAAVRLFFRNDELTVPAGRETIEARVLNAVERAIMSQAGGLFDDAIDGAAILRAARFATEPFAELSPTERARLLSEAAGGKDVATGRLDAEAARRINDPPSPTDPLLLDATNDGTQAPAPTNNAGGTTSAATGSAEAGGGPDQAAQGNQAAQAPPGGEAAAAPGLITYKGRTFIDTRPEGRIFHGTSDAALAPSDYHYSSKNYYGMGFYTTSAVDVAWGYSAARRGGVNDGRHLFEIVERSPVRFFDAEADLRGGVKDVFDIVEERQTGIDLFDIAMSENPKNLRELYDNIREWSASENVSADGVQEIFDNIRYTLEEFGYGGIVHTGGLRTNAVEHQVKIYWYPKSQIELRKASFDEFDPPPARRGDAAPAAAPTLEFRQAKFEQPFTDLDTLFSLAPASQKELIDALEAAGVGKVKDPGIKARDGERGVEAKVTRKGYDDIREVTDVSRAGVIITTPADAEKIVETLGQRFTIWDEGWKVSDVGYSDRKVMVRTSNGLLAEVQILEESFAAAKKAGHKLYEAREAARIAGETDRAKQVMAEEKRYWSERQAALPADWRAALGLEPKASSSEPNASLANASSMRRPSNPISPEDTGIQPRFGESTNPSSVSSSTTANRASQLNSLNGASDIGTSDPRVARGDAEINARVKSMMNEIGPETRLPFEQADGSMKDMTVTERMAEVEKQKRAAAELNDCIARNGGGGSA